jgi:DNA-binding CsgD family transcriptional regulator
VGPFYALIISLLATDALDLGVRHLDQALAVARARGSVPAIAFLTAHRGWFHLRSGAVAEAEADARATLDIMNAHTIRLGTRFAIALLIEVLIENGPIDVAEQTLCDYGFDGEIPPGLANLLLLEARGALRIARGDLRGGFEDLVEYGRRDELWGAANSLASRWRSRACLALAAAGDLEQARRMAAADVERARRWGTASGIGVALRAAALVDADAGAMTRLRGADEDTGAFTRPRGPAADAETVARPGEAAARGGAIERLREAVNVLRESPARLEHARALTDLGAALRRANRRAEARGALQDALTIARSCGAGALVERASMEFSAAGGRCSDATGSGAERLTVSERRVAELAAKGYSNPKIAQALFVTRKTVETHLGHIYAKLEISSRGELAAALAGGGRPSGRC